MLADLLARRLGPVTTKTLAAHNAGFWTAFSLIKPASAQIGGSARVLLGPCRSLSVPPSCGTLSGDTPGWCGWMSGATALGRHLPLTNPALLAPPLGLYLGQPALLRREMRRTLDRAPAGCHDLEV